MHERDSAGARGGEAGFSLIETLVAIIVLVVGIAAVANLMVIAGSSNMVANHGTAAAAVGSQQLEVLKAVTAPALAAAAGGDINPNTVGAGPTTVCGTFVPGSFNCDQTVDGVGTVHVKWRITVVGVNNELFIEMLAQPMAPAVRQRGQILFTSLRTPS